MLTADRAVHEILPRSDEAGAEYAKTGQLDNLTYRENYE